jgi:hypothetical protein
MASQPSGESREAEVERSKQNLEIYFVVEMVESGEK